MSKEDEFTSNFLGKYNCMFIREDDDIGLGLNIKSHRSKLRCHNFVVNHELWDLPMRHKLVIVSYKTHVNQEYTNNIYVHHVMPNFIESVKYIIRVTLSLPDFRRTRSIIDKCIRLCLLANHSDTDQILLGPFKYTERLHYHMDLVIRMRNETVYVFLVLIEKVKLYANNIEAILSMPACKFKQIFFNTLDKENFPIYEVQQAAVIESICQHKRIDLLLKLHINTQVIIKK